MNKKNWLVFILIFIGFVLFLGVLYLRLLSVRSDAAKTINELVLKPVKTITIVPTEGWIYKEVLGR
ncbi:MAG: hypothetical protein GTO02_18330, partial [Candidatus Dadabacteria bacterium]|nr:hypothetical protein [Candidatus Dadabacteria bacterium]NIQ16271.1 hypothetical protein [Candidatus Dadabacteria bacterium]